MENYLKAKLLILDHLKGDAKIIVNKDDEYSKYFSVTLTSIIENSSSDNIYTSVNC